MVNSATRMARNKSHKRHIIRLLPDELLTKIIHLLPRADQLALCRVSKHFHKLAVPFINRDVLISTFKGVDVLKLHGFCFGVIVNAGRAELVRSLQVIKSCSYSENAYDHLVDSIKLMKRLERFALDILTGDGGPIVPRLAYLSLANLFGCRFILPATNLRAVSVAQFLLRHDNLTHVRLWDTDGPHIHPLLPQWDATCLPNLQQYQGTPAFFRIFSTRRLQAVRVVSLEETRGVRALARLTDPVQPWPLVVSIGQDDIRDIKILNALSACMPYITTLELRRWDFNTKFTQQSIKAITRALPHFPRLRYLSLSFAPASWFHTYRYGDVVPGKSDCGILCDWANACPTMVACCLGYQAWRKVPLSGFSRDEEGLGGAEIGNWEGYPRCEFDWEAGLAGFDDGAF